MCSLSASSNVTSAQLWSRRALALLCLLFSLFGLRKPAIAAEPAPTVVEARTKSAFSLFYERAVASYQAGRYAAAIEDLLVAYKLRPEPRLLFNIAQSYRKLDDVRKAKQFFTQYLEADKAISAEMKGEVERYVVELTEQEPPEKSSAASTPRPELTALPRQSAAQDHSSGPKLPRWQKALGSVLIVSGIVVMTSGITFLGLDGKCTEPAAAPALACGFIYHGLVPGAAQTAVGSALSLAGTLSLVIPYALSTRSRSRPFKPSP